MESVFEISGAVMTVHLPVDLDHPVSDSIRRESDRIIGQQYIKNMIFDFSETALWTVQVSDCSWEDTGRWECGENVQVIHANSHIRKLLRLSGIGRYIDISEAEKTSAEQEGAYYGKHK